MPFSAAMSPSVPSAAPFSERSLTSFISPVKDQSNTERGERSPSVALPVLFSLVFSCSFPSALCDVIFLKPASHVIRKTAAAGIMNGEAFSYLRIRCKLRDGREALPEAASAVRAEGNDLFTGKVIFFQEGSNRHRD